MADNSVDSIVTDPPYELGFMGKKWDSTGIANNVELWKECLRVLKPGGHLLAFSGTRTYHRMASAIEDAGFEVRDMVEWCYGSGFPKSLNIGKAVDKIQGNEREVIGKILQPGSTNKRIAMGNGWQEEPDLTKGTSAYEGWGTALKPAHEPICMARKPLSEKSVAENCLKWGTGGINIDESRVEYTDKKDYESAKWGGAGKPPSEASWKMQSKVVFDTRTNQGRFPANLIHDNSEEVRECFPETKSIKSARGGARNDGTTVYQKIPQNIEMNYECGFNDSGNASRFFKSIIYTAKASKSERNRGCEELEEKQYSYDGREKQGYDDNDPEQQRLKDAAQAYGAVKVKKSNFHPTVKPIALMEYLIKMVTPKGGIVLDPFMGSGSTGVACKKNGYNFIGIELEPDYIKIAEARIGAVQLKQEELL